MSWAEVKKLNSDLSTPLNLAALINHIDLVGESYIGYGNAKGTADILATDEVYNHVIAKTILCNLIADYSDVAVAVVQNSTAFQKVVEDSDIKMSMAGAIADYSDVAVAVTANDVAFKAVLEDSIFWATASQSAVIVSHCETKLSASTGVGEWLAFLADSDNATLIACDTINAVAASETAMNAIAVSETAMTAVAASETAISEIITNDQSLYSIAVNNDTGLGLSKLASGIEGMATTAWENNTKWGAIKSTLDASSLFTKSGLLTDTGAGTKNRTGNLITLIDSVVADNYPDYNLSITPRYTGCYAHAYAQNWSTGKHIMWGGHSSTHAGYYVNYSYVKHYMYTPII